MSQKSRHQNKHSVSILHLVNYKRCGLCGSISEFPLMGSAEKCWTSKSQSCNLPLTVLTKHLPFCKNSIPNQNTFVTTKTIINHSSFFSKAAKYKYNSVMEAQLSHHKSKNLTWKKLNKRKILSLFQIIAGYRSVFRSLRHQIWWTKSHKDKKAGTLGYQTFHKWSNWVKHHELWAWSLIWILQCQLMLNTRICVNLYIHLYIQIKFEYNISKN